MLRGRPLQTHPIPIRELSCLRCSVTCSLSPVATLGYSLQNASTAARRVWSASPPVRAAGWEPLEVGLILPPNNGQGIGHGFVDQYTKLHLWSLDELLGVHCVVYLYTDILVRRNLDDLFDLPFPFGRTCTTATSRSASGAPRSGMPWWTRCASCITRTLSRSPKDGKNIVDGLGLERGIEKAKRHRGGVHAEAFGWWMDAYNEFRTQKSIHAGAVRPLVMKTRRTR